MRRESAIPARRPQYTDIVTSPLLSLARYWRVPRAARLDERGLPLDQCLEALLKRRQAGPVQRAENLAALAARRDHPGVEQHPYVPRHQGLRGAQVEAQVGDATLAGAPQFLHDIEPGPVGQGFKVPS